MIVSYLVRSADLVISRNRFGERYLVGVGDPTQIVRIVYFIVRELCRTEAVDWIPDIFIGHHGDLHKQKEDNRVVVAEAVYVVVIVNGPQSLVNPDRSQDVVQSGKTQKDSLFEYFESTTPFCQQMISNPRPRFFTKISLRHNYVKLFISF